MLPMRIQPSHIHIPHHFNREDESSRLLWSVGTTNKPTVLCLRSFILFHSNFLAPQLPYLETYFHVTLPFSVQEGTLPKIGAWQWSGHYAVTKNYNAWTLNRTVTKFCTGISWKLNTEERSPYIQWQLSLSLCPTPTSNPSTLNYHHYTHTHSGLPP